MPTKTTPGVTVLLTQLSRVVYRRTPEEVLGMRLKEFVMLAHLREHNPIPQQELGEMLCIDANNLVLLLNDLETKGFALRRRDPSDRRRHLVEITEGGLQAFEGAERGIESVEDDVLASLSGRERSELQVLLAKALEGAPPALGT
ncbi:MAG TPA: MarR family winged helix-turn-helix transcriptional regulator [Acidimicrobiales bacterium]|jgi:DNA-binding MarR family transcriptional regulator|nr:MarR family winged helix-turn-helix transcriptional regulator [Acidimicrobiales bacterium]